jgi:hypothetical protein
MACTFPYIEKNFRESNPEAADKLNQIGLDTWTEIKDSKLFTQKEGSFVFNKEGTIKREKQNQLANSINEKLNGNVVTESNKKVSVNLSPIFGRYEQIIPQVTSTEMQMEAPTVSQEPLTPKVDVVKLEWDEYEKVLQNPNNATLESVYLINKFKGYDSLEQYKDVAEGNNPQAFSEYADSKLYELLKDFTDTVGIGIKDITEYQQNHLERTGRMISASGVADLINKTIYVADGNLDGLTEEVAHFIVAMLPKDNPLYQAIDAYLENTPEFDLYYDVYLDKYQGDETKTRDEIMGKIIKNALQGNKEKAPLSLKTLINYILDYINSIFSDKALQYRQATASIKQMFFAQSLVENLSDLDTANEEMYQLSYDILGEMTTLESTSPQTIVERELEKTFSNISNTLENYVTKAQQTGNKFGENVATQIIKDIQKNTTENLDKDALFVETQKTISESLNKVNMAFGRLKKDNSNALTSLFATGGRYNVNEMTKLENQEYTQRLKEIGSWINYIQNLKDLALTLNQLRDIVATIENDNPRYKEIIETLNPNLANNNLFKQSMKLMNSSEISNKIDAINSAYTSSAKILVDGLLKATTTADQKDFIEKNRETTPESTKDSLTWMQSIFMPTTMQSDTFLQEVNSFVSFVLRKAQDDTFKAEVEILEIKKELGNINQEFMSSKDEKGNLTFDLLTKFNYTTYSNQKTQYLLEKVIPSLLDNSDLIGAKDFLTELASQPFASSKEIYEYLATAYLAEGKLTDEDFNYINNYLEASENLYNLKRFVPSQGLSDVAKESVKRYIETSKRVHIEALENPYYDWSSDSVKDALSAEIDAFDLYDAMMEKLDEREKMLKKRYYTFDEQTTDITTNLPFKDQYYRVEGLLNFYKTKLGYTTDKDGLFLPSFIKLDKFGEDYLFELSGEEVEGVPATYIDQEYKKLEEESKDLENKNNAKAIAKLKLIEKQKEFNKFNNNPINSLASYPKRESEFNTIKFFGKRYRMHDLISRIAIPISFAAYVTPAMLSGDFSFANQYDVFSLLPLAAKTGAFMVNIGIASQLMRAFSIATDNFSRDISSIKDATKIFKTLAKSLGQTFRALDFDMTQAEEDRFPAYTKYDYDVRVIEWFKRMIAKLKGRANTSKVVVNTPSTFKNFNIIPQWQKNQVPAALRSTQFIDNFIQDIASTNDYNAKVSFEGVLKYMDEAYKSMGDRATGANDFIENAYLNRVWYGRMASKTGLRKLVNIVTRTLSRMFLTGNVLADIKNLMQAQLPLIVKGGPLLYAKSSVKAGMYSLDMLWKAVTNNKMAAEANFIQQIKKRMRILQQTGITERDSGQSLLANKLDLSNTRLLNSLGESFIASQIIFMMLNDNKLVDDKGNQYDITKNFELKDGIFQLKKGAPQPYFSFVTKGQVKQLSSIDLFKINPAGTVSVANLSEEGKKTLTPSELDVQNYINLSFIKKLEYFAQKTQGVYNTVDKPIIATTAVGHMVYMFSNHLAANYATSLGAMKRNINTGELEVGFIRGSGSALKDLIVAGVSSPTKIKAFDNFLLKHNNEYRNRHEENKNQIQNIKDYLSIKNNAATFTAELFTLSNILSASFTTKEIRQIADKIYKGELEYNDLGNSGKSKEEIYKTLYSDYITKKEINAVQAKALRQLGMAIFLGAGMYKVAAILLAKAVGAGDDDKTINEWKKFLALLNQVLWVEAAVNFSGLGILQKLGVDFKGLLQQKAYGKAARGDLGIYQPFGGVVATSFIQENLRNIFWAISVFNYNNFGKKSLILYDDKQEKVIIKVTRGADLPYFRPQYKIKTKPSGKPGKPGKSRLLNPSIPPINMVKQEFFDILFTPGLRDIYKLNPLKADYYKKLPATSVGQFNVKMEKGYVRQTGGRNLVEDITESKEQFKETETKK